MVSPPSVIASVFSALTGEHTSFHRCGRNYVVGTFPLVLEAVGSSQAVPELVENEQLVDIGWLQDEDRMVCGEMEGEDVFGGCR